MNRRRLVRALELAESGVLEPASSWKDGTSYAPVAALWMSAEDLKCRIESRVHAMYRHGFLEEVRGLLEKHTSLSRTALQAIGYAEAVDCLQGRCSAEEAMAATIARTRRLSKRQMTWLRHQLLVEWIPVQGRTPASEVAQRVLEHWRKHGPTKTAY
jgi:tRNA dimethylallyltransferase